MKHEGRTTPLRIVVLLSGKGSNLQAIINSIKNDQLPALVAAVVSNNPDAYGLQRAQNEQIATEVLSHKSFDTRESYDHALMALIDKYQPDLVVLAGFMRILSNEFVDHYAGRMMNIHPSLLPKYKGLNTHQRVLDAGEKEHGCSVHFVTPELDDGPVILQSRIAINDNDTAESLAMRIHEQEHLIYPQAIRMFAENKIIPQHDAP